MQFARIAHATDFMYCYSIIETNRRFDYTPKSTPGGSKPNLSRSNSSLLGPALLSQSMHSELNTFFPFDPYRLPRSSSYIEGVYREWASVAIDDDEEEEEDEEDNEGSADEAQDANDEAEGLLITPSPVGGSREGARDAETDGLGTSFGGMSISPAHPGLAMSLITPMSVS